MKAMENKLKQRIMKNIHVLPTDKPSRLQKNKYNNLFLSEEPKSYSDCTNQNIYITNDEEIKKGDYMLTPHQGVIKWEGDNKHLLKEYCKKVILTTDQDLIKNGVQAIDDEFLEWFVKNPSCEWVEIESTFIDTITGKPIRNWSEYKIIIPKEEPKQEIQLKDPNTCEHFKELGCIKDICTCYTLVSKQETLEEDKNGNIIQFLCGSHSYDGVWFGDKHPTKKSSFWWRSILKEWQQQQNKNLYSEQTVTEYAYYFESCYAQRPMQTPLKPSEWFEQFKKK